MERTRHWGRLLGLGLLAGTLFAGVACGDDDDDFGGDDDDSAADLPGGATVSAPAAGDPGGGNQGELPPGAQIFDRKIIFTAGMTLEVENVGSAFNEVSRIATSSGGFVESSTFTNAGDAAERTSFLTLRVPAAGYQNTLASLRGLSGASVQSESSKSTEVTEEYTDLQSRQRNLERTEQQYLALLERATTIDDILTVQDRLNGVRGQIEQIVGRLQTLDDLTDLATIDVTLTPLPAAQVKGSDGPKGVADSFVDAFAWFTEASRYVLSGVAVLAVAALFLAVPAGIVLAVGLAVRRFRAPGAIAP